MLDGSAVLSHHMACNAEGLRAPKLLRPHLQLHTIDMAAEGNSSVTFCLLFPALIKDEAQLLPTLLNYD